jgi:hypothetical protein
MATIQELVSLACASPEFKRALKSKQVLESLVRYPDERAKQARKDELIRINDDNEATVPTLVKRAQMQLDRFFASPAARELNQALEIIRSTSQEHHPDNLYALRLVAKTRSSGSSTRVFWAPYFDTPISTWLVYGEPMFMTTKPKEIFIRDVRVNRRDAVPGPKEAVYPFLRLGEVRCMLEIVRLFAEQKTPLDLLPCRYSHGLDQLVKGTDGKRSNIIVVGNVFSNGILRAYQNRRNFPFFMEGAVIFKREGKTTIPYPDKDDPEEADCKITHVLLSRRKGVDPTTCVTTIASDNGRAIYRLGKVLCNGSELKTLIEQIPTWREKPDALPLEFQVLVKVWVHDRGDTPVQFVAVDWWLG